MSQEKQESRNIEESSVCDLNTSIQPLAILMKVKVIYCRTKRMCVRISLVHALYVVYISLFACKKCFILVFYSKPV